jgi:hypothetical protein
LDLPCLAQSSTFTFLNRQTRVIFGQEKRFSKRLVSVVGQLFASPFKGLLKDQFLAKRVIA